ncbi:MAG: peroxide stress protein YaaA [Rikenellaceae bacterium]
MSNRKYSVEQRAEHLRQYKSSGLSGSDYCKKHNIAQGTFYGWFKMARKRVAKPPQPPQARGEMIRYMLERKITNPEALKSFEWEGYRYNDALSTDNVWAWVME